MIVLRKGQDSQIGMALQGGGSHGAFTWGVLDALLDGAFPLSRISGASAGAMNAIALASGFLDNGYIGARRSLAAFWNAISELPVPLFASIEHWPSPVDLPPPGVFSDPLREIAGDLFDFDGIRKRLAPLAGIRLFLSATNALTGEARIFTNEEITLDVAMASACLPWLFPAVRIDGQPYWDGGFSANPPIAPLFAGDPSSRVLLIQLERDAPETLPEGLHEAREQAMILAFSVALKREIQLLEEAFGRPLEIHRIVLPRHYLWDNPETRHHTSGPFLHALRRAGRDEGERAMREGAIAIN